MSLATLLKSIEEVISRAGIAPARTEAEIIAGHVLGLTRVELYSEGGREVPSADAERALELARRRAERYPLQYVTGECEFMSLPFTMREGVFIPRPETEVLIETVLEMVRGEGIAPGGVIEVGTGSGVIGVCLGRALAEGGGHPAIVATDISPAAVEAAKGNAYRHGVENLMQFIVGDGISFIKETDGGGRFDLFVCNPPYVRTSEIGSLEPEVRDHEPRAALDGGEDGLAFVRRIVPSLPSILLRGALVALEIAPDQGEAVGRLLTGAGASGVEVAKDLSGRDRVITARMA